MAKKDLIEIFGYAPDDLSREARSLWDLGACPFINKACTKSNHDKTVTYGTCSVTSSHGDVIICPNRLYAKRYAVLKRVAVDAYGDHLPFYLYDEFIEKRMSVDECIVALGQNSGKEVKIGNSFSMDWVLAKVCNGELHEYVGIEVQSIDITNNYRDAWYGYKTLSAGSSRATVPTSAHGLNWANVHKRLIPQIVRKSLIYSRSSFVKAGFYFIVPDVVYKKFEEIIGDLPSTQDLTSETITVYTYGLGGAVAHGKSRDLNEVRTMRFLRSDFAERSISGPNLPDAFLLDNAVRSALGVR